jgi:large repetitive protein
MDININTDGKDNYSVNFEYKIEIMKNGLLIGTLSGRNSGGAAPGPVPINTAINTISDTTPTVGDIISSTTGSWDNSPTAYFYQWYRNEVIISGATSSSYTVVEADYNLPLTCTVVATNANGSSDAVTSNPTSNVLPLPYVNTVIPAISGIATQGNTLTCSTGTFTGQGGVTYAYQWTKNGVDIPGETANTYLVLIADVHY